MKYKYFLASFLSFMLASSTVSAISCGYEEKAKLNSEAGNIKANYEIKERVLDPSEYSVPDAILGTEAEKDYVGVEHYIQVNILNLTENIYAEVTNDKDPTNRNRYYYTEENKGNIKIDWYNMDEVATYTIRIFSSNKTTCENNQLKTLYVKVPRYNDYSEYGVCSEVPGYYLCDAYVTYDKVDFDTFATNIQNEAAKREQIEDEENKKWYQKVGDFLDKHKTEFIIGGLTLVVVAGGATIVIVRKRRRDVI